MEDERTTELRPGGPPPWYREHWWVFLLALLLIVGGIIAFFALRGGVEEEAATVPDVVGLQEDEARAALEEEGFAIEVVREASEEQEGVVFAQDPVAGAVVEEGSTVRIDVSTGPQERETVTETETETEVETERETVPEETTSMPDVVGDEYADAVRDLLDAGLLPDTYPVESGEERGTVTAQRPDAGTSVAVGSAVRLNVALGTDERPEAEVPDLVGLEHAEALLACSEAGFTCRTVAGSEEPRQVREQQPAAGSRAPELTQITLSVGR